MPACCRFADLLFVYLCTLIKHRVIDFEKQPCRSPPPDLFFALIRNPLTVFHIRKCVWTRLSKIFFKKNVRWAHSDPWIYCDDTDCSKLFPAIIPLHTELMDMGPTCSMTSGDVCSVFLPAASVLCFVCITYSLSDFKEMAGEVLSQRLASWLRHLFFFSNQRLLLSKCNNHQEGGIETPTFDLISHRSITVRSAPGFCVQCVT